MSKFKISLLLILSALSTDCFGMRQRGTAAARALGRGLARAPKTARPTTRPLSMTVRTPNMPAGGPRGMATMGSASRAGAQGMLGAAGTSPLQQRLQMEGQFGGAPARGMATGGIGLTDYQKGIMDSLKESLERLPSNNITADLKEAYDVLEILVDHVHSYSRVAVMHEYGGVTNSSKQEDFTPEELKAKARAIEDSEKGILDDFKDKLEFIWGKLSQANINFRTMLENAKDLKELEGAYGYVDAELSILNLVWSLSYNCPVVFKAIKNTGGEDLLRNLLEVGRMYLGDNKMFIEEKKDQITKAEEQKEFWNNLGLDVGKVKNVLISVGLKDAQVENTMTVIQGLPKFMESLRSKEEREKTAEFLRYNSKVIKTLSSVLSSASKGGALSLKYLRKGDPLALAIAAGVLLVAIAAYKIATRSSDKDPGQESPSVPGEEGSDEAEQISPAELQKAEELAEKVIVEAEGTQALEQIKKEIEEEVQEQVAEQQMEEAIVDAPMQQQEGLALEETSVPQLDIAEEVALEEAPAQGPEIVEEVVDVPAITATAETPAQAVGQQVEAVEDVGLTPSKFGQWAAWATGNERLKDPAVQQQVWDEAKAKTYETLVSSPYRKARSWAGYDQ